MVLIICGVVVGLCLWGQYCLGYKHGRDDGDHEGWLRCFREMSEMDRRSWDLHATYRRWAKWEEAAGASDFAPPLPEEEDA